MKTIRIVTVFTLLMACGSAMAQNNSSTYETALGVKLWYTGGGISFKQFVGNNRAMEGIGYFWQHGVRITGLYEFHFDFEGAPGLKWYAGPGAHIGFYNNGYYYDDAGNRHGSNTYIGVDGVLGLDYKFSGAPINLCVDWQPSFEFGYNRGFLANWGGVGVRYTFK